MWLGSGKDHAVGLNNMLVENKSTVTSLNPGLMGGSHIFDPSNHPDLSKWTFLALDTPTLEGCPQNDATGVTTASQRHSIKRRATDRAAIFNALGEGTNWWAITD